MSFAWPTVNFNSIKIAIIDHSRMINPFWRSGMLANKCVEVDAIGFLFVMATLLFGCAPNGNPAVEMEPAKADFRQQETDRTRVNVNREDLWTRTGDDWPGFLGLGRDGKSAETGLNWEWGSGGLPLVWSRELKGGYGIGSAAAGRFYQFDGDGNRMSLVCLNAENGEQIWEFEYQANYRDTYGFDNGPRCSPIVDSNRVYIFGVEGMLHCIHATDGKELWKVNTAMQFNVAQNFFGVGSSPIIFNDLLIVMIGGSPKEEFEPPAGRLNEVKSDGSAIVAFDKITGEVRYRTIDDLASYAAPVIAMIGNKPTGLAFCRSGLFGFDPATGKEHWSFPWRARKYESVNASTPVVDGDQVLITESYGPGGVLLNVAGDKPVPVWRDENIRQQRLSCHWCTPVLVDGFAYACHGEKPNSAEIRCVELATGKVKWKEAGFGRCNLMYVDGNLIGLSDTGSLFVLRANSQRLERLTRYEPLDRDSAFSQPCYAAPIVSHGLLYVRDARKLYCFDLQKR
jgi:outer membrane protein assembly factor BamB